MLNKGANMRKPIIAGNWKMFKTRDEALAFIYAVNESLPSIDDVDTVICAPFVVLRCFNCTKYKYKNRSTKYAL